MFSGLLALKPAKGQRIFIQFSHLARRYFTPHHISYSKLRMSGPNVFIIPGEKRNPSSECETSLEAKRARREEPNSGLKSTVNLTSSGTVLTAIRWSKTQ